MQPRAFMGSVLLVTLLACAGHAFARVPADSLVESESSLSARRQLLAGGDGGKGGMGGKGGDATGGGKAGTGGGGGGGGTGGSSVTGPGGKGGDAGDGGKGGDVFGGGIAGTGGIGGTGGTGGSTTGGGPAGTGGLGGNGGKGGSAIGGGIAGDGGDAGNGGLGGSATGGGNAGPGGNAGTGGNAGSNADCGDNEYLSRLKCIKCVSRESYAFATVYGGTRCLKPFARNSPADCNFGSLEGIRYADSSSPTCFKSPNGSKFKGNLLLPAPGFPYLNLSTSSYNINSISLNGYPAINKGFTTVGGKNYLELKFKSAGPVNLQGQKVFLNGVIIAGGFPVCFSAQGSVCA